MFYLCFVFIVATFLVLNISRLGFCIWHWKRVQDAGGLGPVFLGGLRIDANQIACYIALPLLLAPWLGQFSAMVTVTQIWCMAFWLIFVFLEISTPQFLIEYDTRPNRLYVEYLKHPKEVLGMLWRGYKLVVGGGLVFFVFMIWVASVVFSGGQVKAMPSIWLAILSNIVTLAIAFLVIRGTLKRRPINPSTVAFSSDSMVNTLPLNSLYNVTYAIYAMKYEMSAEKVYGRIESEEMNQIICEQAQIPYASLTPESPTLHKQEATKKRDKPLNIVLIVEESLGAQYVSNLGGQKLTPCLDKLAQEAWNFKRCYATGTRSVRGLEAISAGFAPTITQAVFKLPGAQTGFFTLAAMLDQQFNYHSRFLYGGEAHFDNMRGFFLGNGFKEVVDGPLFKDPQFLGTWGYSDEDMFNQLDRLLQEDHDKDQPTLTLAFSVSNHTPWEYPSGRIEPDGNPATVENTVRYADFALGQFFDKAKTRDYWKDTIFLIAADHDSRVFGASLIPLKHFHIPALILGADIEAKQDERLISQLDLAPTILSLAGINSVHPMIGRDLTQYDPNRAMMQYGDNYGYLKGDDLVVLEPHKPAQQFSYVRPESYTNVTTNEALAKEALAHAIWPYWAYSNKNYKIADKEQL